MVSSKKQDVFLDAQKFECQIKFLTLTELAKLSNKELEKIYPEDRCFYCKCLLNDNSKESSSVNPK